MIDVAGIRYRETIDIEMTSWSERLSIRRAGEYDVAPAVNRGDDVRRARSFAAGIERKL